MKTKTVSNKLAKLNFLTFAFCLLLLLIAETLVAKAISPLSYYKSISDYYHTGWCGLKTGYYHHTGHLGTDFAAPAYTPIKAIKSGTVVKCVNTNAENEGTGYGNHVKIKHSDGSHTLYAHMNATAVKEGMYIRQGDIIGYVGSTGSSTGDHLHLEYFNPSGNRRSVLDYYRSYTNKVSSEQILRKTASSSGTKITTIPSGGTIKITGKTVANNDTWFMVTYGDYSGYIPASEVSSHGPYDKTNSSALLIKDELPKSTSKTYKVGKYKILDSYKSIKFQESHTYDSELLGSVPGGTEVIVSDVCGLWGKVTYEDYTGWINLKYTENLASGFFLRFYKNGGTGTTMKDQLCIYGEQNDVNDCEYVGENGEAFRYWTAYNTRTKKWYYADENNNPKGWYKSGSQPEGYARMHFFNDHIFSKITSRGSDVIMLFAVYGTEIPDYEITLDACSGNIENNELLITSGNTYGQLPIPTKAGYAFLGWFTQPEGGEQITSLDKPTSNTTLYAHWINRDDRTSTNGYKEWTSDELSLKYICALSKLLVQTGQQSEASFDPSVCYAYLKSTDMIGTSNGVEVVRTSKYAENGFLELYAPELTFHGIINSEDYENEESFNDELQALHEASVGLLVKVFTNEEKDSLCWRMVTKIENNEIYILDETNEVSLSENYYGIDYAHAFQFHGIMEAPVIPDYIPGEYTIDTLDDVLECFGSVNITNALTVPESGLIVGNTYKLIVAGYNTDNTLLWADVQSFSANEDNNILNFSHETSDTLSYCRAFIIDKNLSPVKWLINFNTSTN